MKRLLAISLLAFVPLAVAPAAPVPTHLMKPPEYYLPTRVGAKLVYEYRGYKDGPASEIVEVVTSVKDRNGHKTVTLARVMEDGKLLGDCAYGQSPDGLTQGYLSGTGNYVPSAKLLPLPVKDGEEWEKVDGLDRPRVRKHMLKTTGAETVRVPAGTFEAVRVDEEITTTAGITAGTTWYAPGVGLVKWTDKDGRSKILTAFLPNGR